MNKMLLEQNGAVQFLASSLIKNQKSNSFEIIDEALHILLQLQVSDTFLKRLTHDKEFLNSLVFVLKCGSHNSRGNAIMLLESILSVADPTQLINVEPESVAQVVHILQDKISVRSSKTALKILMEVCKWGRNRIKAVEANAVIVLVELLLETELERRVCELVLVVLDMLCGCAEGRAELLKHGAGLAVVSKKVLRVSRVGTDRAVRILLSVCRFSASSRVLQEMLQVGVVSKLCLVLQVECGGGKTKGRVKEILGMHSRVWRDAPCIPSHLLSSYPAS